MPIEYSPKSIEAKYRKASPEGLWDDLGSLQIELGNFNVWLPVSTMIHGGAMHGYLYEDKRPPQKGRLNYATPINCLMSLLHAQPELRELPIDQFEKLAGVVSRTAMVVEQLHEKTNFRDWPAVFKRSPNEEALKLAMNSK